MKSYPNRVGKRHDVRLLFPIILTAVISVYLISLSSCNTSTQESYYMGDLGITLCGTVQFTGGCGEETDSLMPLGLALIHHMTYEEAEGIFDKVIENDPTCFWGPWGKAMTYIHPLWNDQPNETQMKTGWELSQKSAELASTDREKQYAEFIAAYYRDGQNRSLQERLISFHEAWKTGYENFPEDLEIKSFYALSLISVADPKDKTYKNQLRAGELANEVLEEIPGHPGGFHYTIHAYDYPELAIKATFAAENYSNLAPEVAHALHMPSHIFTRLGMWDESIEWNRRSAAAALNSIHGSGSLHFLHAKDYIVYALLQQLKDDEVTKELEEIDKMDFTVVHHPAAAYALAAMEARFALERQDWNKAASIQIQKKHKMDWDRFPEYEAISHFAIGLGAARSGDFQKATLSFNTLQNLASKIANPYWVEQVQIQAETVNAWTEFGKGNKEKALQIMERTAEREAATNKHPITPGEVLPASELLGDMLLVLKRPDEALTYYEAALDRSPERFNSLHGAAKAAEMAGNQLKAESYFKKLKELTKNAQTPHPEWGVAYHGGGN